MVENIPNVLVRRKNPYFDQCILALPLSILSLYLTADTRSFICGKLLLSCFSDAIFSFCKTYVPFNPLNTKPACIYLLDVNNGNPRAMCKICAMLAIKTRERRQWQVQHILANSCTELKFFLESIVKSVSQDLL